MILGIAVLAAVVAVIVYFKKKNSKQRVAPETQITITHSKNYNLIMRIYSFNTINDIFVDTYNLFPVFLCYTFLLLVHFLYVGYRCVNHAIYHHFSGPTRSNQVHPLPLNEGSATTAPKPDLLGIPFFKFI